ncbi:hypothetical protein Glove_165g82 [Diversispora epigaea]|uniref:ZSWIM1/3 RNaseH-like domain-containing protein n=1 Tax=Diversispora epigaea TaxID=1348612 RepID=A0A397IVG2_9GLOM|nr:hypothetical protein Glove_165g82 [Diversispora epigaea]
MSTFDKENLFQEVLPTCELPQSHELTITNIIATDSITSLTSNQKRILLFNVQQPFEVPMKEFDDEWWPLVTNIWIKFSHKDNVNGNSWKTFVCRFNKHFQSSTRKEDIPSTKRRKTKVRTANLCFAKIKILRFDAEQKVRIERFQDSPDHAHSIEESDKLKRPQAVRVLVEKEAVKNYPVPAIVDAVKEYATENMDLGTSIKELKWREVANIKYKIRGSQNTYLNGSSKLSSDIQDAISFLKKEGYQVELYTTQSTRGFVFARLKQLEKLQKYGWLTLIDSIHKTNRYDWRLFTLYIRDGYGCWDIGGHFFVSNEDSNTVVEALMIIRRFCSSWKPRYFLADQSSIEAKSIVMAFPGLQKGEQECDVIFCTVHVMRTWMDKIYDPKTRNKMVHAMHKRTKIGCEMLIQQSIEECALTPIKRYIIRYYLKNTRQWALWARQHSPLLLQVTSTNALESYHSELKRTTSSQHGLIGACNKIVALDSKKRSDSDYVAFEFHVKKISAAGIDDDILREIHKFPFPIQKLIVTAGIDDDILREIHKFPFPIQKLIVSEIFSVEGRIEKGKDLPGLMSLECQCLFFRKYMLPCKHIFHEQIHGPRKLLTIDAWKQFQQTFDESGFEIYEHRELINFEILEKNENDRAAENRKLTVNELMERTRNEYWNIEENGDEKEKREFLERLKTCLDPILKKNNN